MGDIEKSSKLVLSQCFMCSGWTPPNLMRNVVLDNVEQRVCIACYRKLERRVSALVVEAEKEQEESVSEDEIAASFGNSEREED